GYFTRELVVNGNRPLNVTLLKDAADLDGVVVIGYGVQKKVHLTGAVSVIDEKLLENRPVSNVLGAMQGAAAGLIITRSNGQPGKEGWAANIRGITSLNGT